MTTKFEFDGIKCSGRYQWGNIKLTIDTGIEDLGVATVTISVPVADLDEKNYLQLKQELLSLAQATIQTQSMIDWIAQQHQK